MNPRPCWSGAPRLCGLNPSSPPSPIKSAAYPLSNGFCNLTPSWAKSLTFRVTTVIRCTMAVAAIMASSVMASDRPCISRANSRNTIASIGSTPYEARTLSSQVLQLLRLSRILLSRDFNPRLYLANRNGRHEEQVRRRMSDPLQNCPVRPWAAQL